MTDVTKENEKYPAGVANKKAGVAPVSDDAPVAGVAAAEAVEAE